MFRDHEILVSQNEVLDTLLFYDFLRCFFSPEFTTCVEKAIAASQGRTLIAVLLATDLLEQYDVLETRKVGRTYRLYGYDEDGKKHLLMTKYNL